MDAPLVLITDWPGHKKLDVLVATDVSMSPSEIIQQYCQRWTLGETFGWVKYRPGLEDPHNRTEHAVERTAPMALWAHSLVALRYAKLSSPLANTNRGCGVRTTFG